MAGGDLNVPERNPCIEGRHDERRSEHVGVHRAQPRLFPDRAHPPVSRAPVQTLAIPPEKNRPFAALTDGEVDGPGRPWHQRNDGRLASLAHDPKRAVSLGEGEVLDIGPAGFADP